jgi:hypothetical protein
MSRKIPLAVGFANFSGEDFALLASEDLAAISPLFETTIVATTQQIPRVDVIFIYARFAASGALEQSSQTVVSARSRTRQGQGSLSRLQQFLKT